MSSKISVVEDETITSPIILREGDEVVFQVWVPGVTSGITSDATLTMAFYKTGSNTDLSSTYLTGSMSVVGTDVIQTKQTQNLKAGDWAMGIKATVDGLLYTVATIPVIVKSRSEL